jgi:glycerophosphoryl diester phosphodiesterase
VWPLIAIAHAYANRRDRWQRALDAGVDLIETDLRFDGEQVWVRHERRLGPLPLLYDRGLRGIHAQGPYAMRLGRWNLRLELRPIPLRDVARAVSGRAGLLLDFKRGEYGPSATRAFVDQAFGALDAEGFQGALDCCGSWELLDVVRERRPDTRVHYSVDSAADWERMLARLRRDNAVPGVTIKSELLDDARAGELRERGLHFYVWNVFTDDDAQRARRLGAAGIIADDLELLRRHAGPATGSERA